MTTQTLKRTRAKFVSKQTVEQVGILLQELPEKTSDSHSLRQTVEQLRETIEAALAKGYSYEDLVSILAQQGIDIQPSTLKRYILTGSTRSKTKRSTSGKTQTRQTRKQSESAATTEESLETAETSAPTATTSSKKKTKAVAEKRGRAAAKVSPQPTATETAEAQPKTPKQSPARRSSAASSATPKSSTTSNRKRKSAKA